MSALEITAFLTARHARSLEMGLYVAPSPVPPVYNEVMSEKPLISAKRIPNRIAPEPGL